MARNLSFHLPPLARLRLSRWLLALAVCWQALVMFMSVAQAKAPAGEGQWETICTMQGSSQIWVVDGDANSEPQAESGEHCPLCLMSQTGIAPPAILDVKVQQAAGAKIGQLAFTAVYLTRAWSEPATGPPAQL